MIRRGPSGVLADIDPSDLLPGTPGQQLTAGPGTGVPIWADPLGHNEETILVGGTRETDQVVQVGQSVAEFDPSVLLAPTGGLVRAITFEAIAWATAGMTAEVELWNITDGVAVVGTLLAIASTVPTWLVSVPLAVPAVLPNASTLYELRLRISAGVPGPLDRAFVSQARLLTMWS